MSFQDPQNPGIGGLDELTDAETLFVQQIAALPYVNGDILYYNNGQLRRLPKGTDGNVLVLASGLPSWGSTSGTGDFSSNTATSVDSEIVLFSGTGGKTGKRATGTGVAYLTSGVLSVSKVTLTQPATGSTLTIVDGKTLTANNTITLAGTDGTTITFQGTDTYIGRATTDTLTNKTLTTPVLNGLPTGNVSSSATGSTLASRDANGNTAFVNVLEGYTTTATAAGTTTLSVSSNYQQFFTGATTQTVTLPVATTLINGQSWLIVNNSTGAVTVQTSGANTLVILAGGTSALVTCINTAGGTGTASWSATYLADIITSGKKFSVSNTLTLAGTDGTTMTFPSTSATIARTDAANTFTGTQTFSGTVDHGAQSITITGSIATTGARVTKIWTTDIESTNAPTVGGTALPTATSTTTLTNKRITPRTGTTASSATPTINTDNVDFYSITALAVDITSFTTNLSGTPTDGQKLWIAITGTAARAITWGTSFESSTATLPTTTVTTNRLDVGFVWNTATSKWRCVAVA